MFELVFLFAIAVLGLTIHVFGRMRLRSLLRVYALSSLALAGVIATIPGEQFGWEHWTIIAATVIIKGFLLPFLVLRRASSLGTPLRLISFLRPSVAMLLASLIAIIIIASLFETPLLAIAISCGLLGILFMIIRRDVMSQIIGFLMLENGIAFTGIVTVGSTSLLIELGFFCLIILIVLLMVSVVKDLYTTLGSIDTERLRELNE